MRWKIKSQCFLFLFTQWNLNSFYEVARHWQEEQRAPPRRVGSQGITASFWDMGDVYLKPSGWEVELLQECRSCWVIQWSSSGIYVAWFGLKRGPGSLLWEEHAPPRSAWHSPAGPARDLGRWKPVLWSPSRARHELGVQPRLSGDMRRCWAVGSATAKNKDA